MALRAVVFDYGMVLSAPRDLSAHEEAVRLTGLPEERFEQLYWADRHQFDLGNLSGLDYWRKFARDGGLSLSGEQIRKLDQLDCIMWATVNEPMVAWQASLKKRGLRTAILSNMGDSTHAFLIATHAWIANFDIRVFSHELRIAKPDPAIYTHTLVKLGVPAREALFIDDKAENIAVARELGFRAIQFFTADKLHADLIAAGLDKELPLP